MAVVQISRIQLRRGKKNTGTGIPQLASGELAWAIDSQELYIGNGSVAEGAPAVGNTKIITDKDNLLDISTYVYRDGTAEIRTGSDVNYPTVRTLQQKLDDRVSSADYGIVSGPTDQTATLQRLIDNLFLDMTYEGIKSRVVIDFEPGEYTFSNTVYLPSYVAIVGAGKQRTVFNYDGEGTMFEFVNDTSTKTVRSVIGSTTYNNQPKHCYLKGFTVNTNEPDVTAFKLNAVRDSIFEDVEITGSFGDSAVSNNSMGLSMYALSAVVTCQRNVFHNVYIKGFTFAVFAKQDIINNRFLNSQVTDSRYGFYLGVGANVFDYTTSDVLIPGSSTTGEAYGPRTTTIENCYFENIDREAIKIDNGYGNKSKGNTFVNVGNDGGGYQNNLYSIITFGKNGNASENDTFDRSNPFRLEFDLQQHNFSELYVKEVSGKVHYKETETRVVKLTHYPSSGSAVTALRLPTTLSTGFEINYVLESQANVQMRRGKIVITYDVNSDTLQLADEYEYVGALNQDTRIKFTASSAAITDCIALQYTNDNSTDTLASPTLMTYTYTTIS